MREPAFWRAPNLLAPNFLATVLAPLGGVYAGATARRVSRAGWVAGVPVICCGGATAGGAGKTPLALDLATRLLARGCRPAFITRGHGGRRAALPVDLSRDDADAVGDEALLLAACAATFAGADRVAGARAAIAAGADVLVMDDGLQNPSLVKTLPLLVVDGASGFGNRRVIPAGPLREPAAAAAARCRAAVLIGPDLCGALEMLPAGLPVLRARLVPEPGSELEGIRVVAFAGIARPEKFLGSLREVGAEVVAMKPFPDHHRFRPRELERLARQAEALGARLATTAKDAARLPAPFRGQVTVLRVSLAWEDAAAIEALLDAP